MRFTEICILSHTLPVARTQSGSFDLLSFVFYTLIAIALTGGIATGKSAFSGLLRELSDGLGELFDCDAAVHDLLTTPPIVDNISRSFGPGVITPEGQVSRSALRSLVFADESQRKNLEAILHPEVLAAAVAARNHAIEKNPSLELFTFEVPLLYEAADFPLDRDMDIVVAASETRQRQRLKEIRQLDDHLTEAILAAQMPIDEKINRADRVVWNDGPMNELEEQALLFLGGVLQLA